MVIRRLRRMMEEVPWLRRWLPPVDRSYALQGEIQFWRAWFTTRGLQWPDDYPERFNPDQPIQKHIAQYINRLDTERVHILDVGSGPVTKLGKKLPPKELIITATDLLADEYDRLLEELKIEPLVRTTYADAERLAEQFGQNAFDIVHGQNCINHTADPPRAIQQMIAVCKPEGFVVLYHAEKEGEREKYRQLHQWDFACENRSFVIGDRRGRKTDVTQLLARDCEVECTRIPNDEAILTGIWKKAH